MLALTVPKMMKTMMKKVHYLQRSAVQPIPLTVTHAEFEMSEMAAGLDEDEEDGGMSGDDNNDEAVVRVQKKKTKKDRSRAERRRNQDLAFSEKKSLKAMRRDIDSAKKLTASIIETEEEQSLVRDRRQVRTRNPLAIHSVPAYCSQVLSYWTPSTVKRKVAVSMTMFLAISRQST